MPVNDEERITFRRPESLSGVETISVENGRHLWRVLHETYTFCSVLGNSWGEWIYRRKMHRSTRGHLMMLEPGEIHDTRRMSDKAFFQVALLNKSVVTEVAQSLDFPAAPHLGFPLTADPEAVRAFLTVHRSIKSPGSPLEQQTRLIHALGLILQKKTEKGEIPCPEMNSKPGLRRVKEYLMTGFARKVELAELSRVAGMSQFHFIRSFAREFGMPPHAYQNAIRVLKAKQMLNAGLMPNYLDVGFTDQSHFIRHFKKAWGVTPGSYRSMVRRPFSGAGSKG